jgi:hypothetical protein
VKRADDSHDPEIPREKDIRFMAGVGPVGFSQAVDDLLGRTEEERSASR